MLSRRVPSAHPYLRDRYQLLELIGDTPYRRTYLAQDLWDAAATRYVIKHYARSISERGSLEGLVPASRDLLCREWNCTESLAGYEGIPQGITTFQEQGECYLVQEWIEGRSLADYLAPDQYGLKSYSETEVVQWLRGVLPLLAHVHEAGWSHGDLKPSHLRYCQREQKWKLLDLGRARPVRGGSLMQQATSWVMMSPFGYMPIERIQGKYYASSDLYSVGMMGLQLLTGLKPLQLRFCRESGEIDWEECLGQPLVLPEFGMGLGMLLSRLTNYFPERRYQSATDALKALHQLESSVVMLGEGEGEAQPEEEVGVVLPVRTPPQMKKLMNTLPWYPERLPILGGVGVGFLAVNALSVSWGEVYPTLNFVADEGTAKEHQGKQHAEEQTQLMSSVVSSQVQDTAQQWRQEWQLAQSQYRQIVDAIAHQNWEQALTLASTLPNTNYWQHKLQPLVQRAQHHLDLQAQELLQQATQYATQKQYHLALNTLGKISPHTAYGRQVQPQLVALAQQGQAKAAQPDPTSATSSFEPTINPDEALVDSPTPPVDPQQVIITSGDIVDPVDVEVESLFTTPGSQLQEISPLL